MRSEEIGHRSFPNLRPHLPVHRHLERMPRSGRGGRNAPTGSAGLPGLRGKSWREMAFLHLLLVGAACSLCGGGRRPAALTQAALPLDGTTSTLIWHPKHARRNKSPDRGLVRERGKSVALGRATNKLPDQCGCL